MLFIHYSECTTCQKAKRWLDDNRIEYIRRNIKENNPTYGELKEWIIKSNIPINKFINTSGKLYKLLNLKDKIKNMSEDDLLKLLATSGMLVKRPLIINGDKVLVGFNIDEWETLKNTRAN